MNSNLEKKLKISADEYKQKYKTRIEDLSKTKYVCFRNGAVLHYGRDVSGICEIQSLEAENDSFDGLLISWLNTKPIENNLGAGKAGLVYLSTAHGDETEHFLNGGEVSTSHSKCKLFDKDDFDGMKNYIKQGWNKL